MELLTRFQNYIKKEKLILEGDSVILGVSGGPDSLTMLDLFARIRDDYRLNLLVFHLNHMFRKEASEEALFVKNIAEEYGIRSIIEKVDVPEYIKENGCSPEEGARIVRFELISTWAKKYDIKKVALAHNKDDLVETVFLNLFRGTGLKGLTGIIPLTEINDMTIIHPLLEFLRMEIESYCQKRKLRPRFDPSNKNLVYTRNKIRNIILPQIEKVINPALKEIVSRMAFNIREEEEFLTGLAHNHFLDCLLESGKGRVILSSDGLNQEETVIRRRIIKEAIQRVHGNTIDLYAVHYQAIEEMIVSRQTGKIITLKDNLQVRSSYDELIFEKNHSYSKSEDFIFNLSIPGELKWDNFVIESSIIDKDSNWIKKALNKKICICDKEKIKGSLIVRNRQEGDSFYPFGMSGSKKVKDFFIDEKIPVDKRDRIPIVTDSSGKIIWLAGYRADDRFKVENTTEKLLQIGIVFNGGD